MGLASGVDILTTVELLRRAAAHKGFTLGEGRGWKSAKPVKDYRLDDRLLAALARRNIVRQPRPDCRGIFTLVDEGLQREVPGWAPSCYWNFKAREEDGAFDLRITVSVDLELNTRERGVVLVPRAHGTFISPADPVPHFRMFRALVEADEDAPAVARELAASDGHLVVFWGDLGLGGIRRLSDLFIEFACGNEGVRHLGHEGRIFDPAPFPQHQPSGDELYVMEPAQPRVFQAWREQIDGYRARLHVA